MIQKRNSEFLLQLVQTMEDAEKRLRQAYLKNDVENFNIIKKFMLQIQKKIDETLR